MERTNISYFCIYWSIHTVWIRITHVCMFWIKYFYVNGWRKLCTYIPNFIVYYSIFTCTIVNFELNGFDTTFTILLYCKFKMYHMTTEKYIDTLNYILYVYIVQLFCILVLNWFTIIHFFMFWTKKSGIYYFVFLVFSFSFSPRTRQLVYCFLGNRTNDPITLSLRRA